MYNILEKLYDGELYPAEQFSPAGNEYEVKQKTAIELYDSFRQKLDPSLQDEFEDMIDAQAILSSVELKQSFVSGFQMGSNMMAQVLVR